MWWSSLTVNWSPRWRSFGMDWKMFAVFDKFEQFGSAFGQGTNWFIKLSAAGSKQVVGITLFGKRLWYASPTWAVPARQLGRAFRIAAKASVPITAVLVGSFGLAGSNRNGEAEKSPFRSAAVGTTVGSPEIPCTMRRPS